MLQSLLLVLISVLVGAIGQIMLKVGMTQVGRLGLEQMSDPLYTLQRVFSTPLILAALPLYGGGLILWLVVLSRLSLSFAYPLLAFTYVINPLLSMLILHESVPLQRWIGIAFIFIGVVIISRTVQ